MTAVFPFTKKTANGEAAPARVEPSNASSPIEAREQLTREAAVKAHAEQAQAAFVIRKQELSDTIQREHDATKRAIADARARADATRAGLDAALAAEIHTELARLVAAFEDDRKAVLVAMSDEWTKWNARARAELGGPVGHAHLLAAFRAECGRLHLYRHGAPPSPTDYRHAVQHEATAALGHALDTGDRVLVAAAVDRMRVAARTPMPGTIEHTDEKRTAAIVAHVTEADQIVALDAFDRRATVEHCTAKQPVTRTETPPEAA